MSFKKRIPNIKKWISKRFLTKEPSADIEVIVRSIGGTGTTNIINYLSEYKNVNDPVDNDGLKHARKLIVAEGQKQIIIISDPPDMYRSLNRRSYLYENCLKLGFISYFIQSKSLFLYECRQLQMKWLSELKDEEHTLFLHYSELFESADKIEQHLHISGQKFKRDFPKRERRKSL